MSPRAPLYDIQAAQPAKSVVLDYQINQVADAHLLRRKTHVFPDCHLAEPLVQ